MFGSLIFTIYRAAMKKYGEVLLNFNLNDSKLHPFKGWFKIVRIMDFLDKMEIEPISCFSLMGILENHQNLCNDLLCPCQLPIKAEDIPPELEAVSK